MGLMHSASWAAIAGGTTEVPEEDCLILWLLYGVAGVYLIPSHNQLNTRAFEQTSWEDVPPSPVSGNEWKKWMHDWSITLWQASLLITARKRWRAVREVLREGFSGGSVVKNPPAKAGDAGDAGSIPGLGRNPEGGNGNPLQYSCRENPMDRGVTQAVVHGVIKSWTQLWACTRIPSAHPPWGRSQAHRFIVSMPSRKWKWGQWIVSLCHKGKGFKCPASLSTSLMATTLQRFCHLSSRWPLPLKLEGVSNIKAKWGDLNDNKERGRSEIPMEGAFHCVQCVFRHDESSKVFNLNSFWNRRTLLWRDTFQKAKCLPSITLLCFKVFLLAISASQELSRRWSARLFCPSPANSGQAYP